MLFIRYGVIVRSEGDQLIKDVISKEKSLKSWQSVVVVDKKRSNELKNVLANFPEILSKPEVKAQIIKSFNFKIPVAYIKLYDNMTEKRARLIEELKGFFFVETVYFNPKPQESALIGIAPITRFKNLCHIATDHLKKYNGQFDKFADLSDVLSGRPLKDLAKFCSPERIRQLEVVLDNYRPEIISGYWVVEEIMGAFTSNKPVTSIDLAVGVKTEVLKKFIEELSEFFSVDSVPEPSGSKFTGDVFVSRFKNSFRVMMDYAKKYNGISEDFADLAGILVGYSPKEVAQYCSHDRMKDFGLIK